MQAAFVKPSAVALGDIEAWEVLLETILASGVKGLRTNLDSAATGALIFTPAGSDRPGSLLIFRMMTRQ